MVKCPPITEFSQTAYNICAMHNDITSRMTVTSKSKCRKPRETKAGK